MSTIGDDRTSPSARAHRSARADPDAHPRSAAFLGRAIARPNPRAFQWTSHGSIRTPPASSRTPRDSRGPLRTTATIRRAPRVPADSPGYEAANRSRSRGVRYHPLRGSTSSFLSVLVAHALAEHQAARHVISHHAVGEAHFCGDLANGTVEEDVHDERLSAIGRKRHEALRDPVELFLREASPFGRSRFVQFVEDQGLGLRGAYPYVVVTHTVERE